MSDAAFIQRLMDEQGEDCRYVNLPDPDSEPDPAYADLFFDEIVEEINVYYREMRAWEEDMRWRMEMEQEPPYWY